MTPERHLSCVSLALIGFCVAYLLPSYATAPNLFYDPLAHRWSFGASSGPIPLGYVGMFAYGVSGALVGVLVSLLVSARVSARTLGLFAVWALSALWLAVAYFVWSLWPA